MHLLRDALPHTRGRAKLKVVGIGNAWRSDDAVGLVVARRLREVLPDGVEVLEREGEPTGLIETWADAEALWLVDAVSSGAPPGTVHRVDASHDELPEQFGGGSTHHFSLGEAVAMARALGRLPDHVVVFGVEGERFEIGDELTPEVAAAVPVVVAAVRGEVQRIERLADSLRETRSESAAEPHELEGRMRMAQAHALGLSSIRPRNHQRIGGRT